MLSQLEFETLVQLLNRAPMTKGELLAVNAILEKLAPKATDKPVETDDALPAQPAELA